MSRPTLPAVMMAAPQASLRKPSLKRNRCQLAGRELAQPLGDEMQGFDNRVYHKAGIAHASADFKRNVGTEIPATGTVDTLTRMGMPARERDPYKPDEIRAAMQAALDRAGISKSRAGKEAGLAERTVGKFLDGGSQTISLANAIRLAHGLNITVSELIGEVMPQSPEPGPSMTEEEINAWSERLLRMMSDLQALRSLRR